MAYKLKKATIEDMEALVQNRVDMLKEVYELAPGEDVSLLTHTTADFYKKHLADDSHVAYFFTVDDTNEVAATGGITFFELMPTPEDETGKRAFIMNMRTYANHRRQGLGTLILDALLNEAKQRGVANIQIEASEMGAKLYSHYGFEPMTYVMYLPKEKQSQ